MFNARASHTKYSIRAVIFIQFNPTQMSKREKLMSNAKFNILVMVVHCSWIYMRYQSNVNDPLGIFQLEYPFLCFTLFINGWNNNGVSTSFLDVRSTSIQFLQFSIAKIRVFLLLNHLIQTVSILRLIFINV